MQKDVCICVFMGGVDGSVKTGESKCPRRKDIRTPFRILERTRYSGDPCVATHPGRPAHPGHPALQHRPTRAAHLSTGPPGPRSARARLAGASRASSATAKNTAKNTRANEPRTIPARAACKFSRIFGNPPLIENGAGEAQGGWFASGPRLL